MACRLTMIVGVMLTRSLLVRRTIVALGPREFTAPPLTLARGPHRGLALPAQTLPIQQITFGALLTTHAIQTAPRYVKGPMPNDPASS